MAKQLNDREVVQTDELLMAQMIQIDTISKLLIEKGIISEEEFFTKPKQVQAEYQSKRSA